MYRYHSVDTRDPSTSPMLTDVEIARNTFAAAELVTDTSPHATSPAAALHEYMGANYGDDEPDDRESWRAQQAVTTVLPRVIAPHDPGLRKYHDIRSEKYPMAAVRPVAVDFKPKTVHHRQYRWYFQGDYPRCTAFGTNTGLAAAHPFNVPPIDSNQLYQLIVAEDHRQGRFFDGGATTVAAMQTGKALGYWDVYRWLYTLTEMQQSILVAPLFVGTNWYPSMWERDRDGVCKSPSKYEQPAGGHFYCLNAYKAGNGLWRYPSTWGDGDYLIPDELMYRLLREEGDAVQPTELKLGADWKVPENMVADLAGTLP